MRTPHTYAGYTKVMTEYWDIKPSVTINFISYYLRNDWIDFHDQLGIRMA